ncbi:uncharacterized protein LOC8034023 [Ixodes scapularis]|uniref:uncharacterized protein LOC8034023 n=1 Tax=Ixodes scapularis TaxID=6945 RepID=UPI001A9EAD95|nr:uncharacterized protein LOC8034023 [Ixodes scapularis]
MWTVAAAHKKSTGPIDSYDSLNDVHLCSHFSRRTVQQRMARIGLVQNIMPDGRPDPASHCCCGDRLPVLGESKNVVNASARSFDRDRTSKEVCSVCHKRIVPAALKKFVSPYLLPVSPASKVRPQPKGRTTIGSSGVNLAMKRRSAESSRSATASSDPTGDRTSQTKNLFPKKSGCQLTFVFRGTGLAAQDKTLQGSPQTVRVTQQHCGGNPLTVYADRISRGEMLTFMSRRHCGYPFSIVIFVDGIRDVQLSSCCEYRYGVGARLGGALGHFTLVDIKGGSPCYKCMLERQFRNLPRDMLGILSLPDRTANRQPVQEGWSTIQAKHTFDTGALSSRSGSPTAASSSDKEDSTHSIANSDSPRTEDVEQSLQRDTSRSDDNCEDQEQLSMEKILSASETDLHVVFSSSPSSAPERTDRSPPETDIAVASANGITDKFKNLEITDSIEPSLTENSTILSSNPANLDGADTEPDSNELSDMTEGHPEPHLNPIHPSVYYVQDKKKQWGSDPGHGESFSSDEEAQGITVTVEADIHACPQDSGINVNKKRDNMHSNKSAP